MTLTENAIRTSLSHIRDPLSGLDVVQAQMISAVTIRAGHVGVMLTIDPQHRNVQEGIKAQIEAAIAGLAGVEKITVVMTSEKTGEVNAESVHAASVRGKPLWITTPLPHVKRVIVVASGKGGVGKSTVTVLLAKHLQTQGLRVGIADADIYGPSIPHLLGISEQPALMGNLMMPLNAEGIAVMSLGLLMPPEQAAIMRGAMASKTLYQLLRGTLWGVPDLPLDVLLIDTPPGTGDVHLSLMQQVPMNQHQGGVVMVTTPSRVAVADAHKSLAMFQKLHIPILGIIENMSYVQQGETRLAVFGEGGGAELARLADAPLLGQLPLMADITDANEAGALLGLDAGLLKNMGIAL
jgi:ATP-binding protein involved in chromosome partitioning